MRSTSANRSLTLLTTTSLLALGLAMAPITVDFDLRQPVLKAAQAKGGGEGGGGEGSSGEGGGEGGGGEGGGEGGEGGEGGHDDDESGEGGGSGGDSFGGVDQVGPDLSQAEEAAAILKGWK